MERVGVGWREEGWDVRVYVTHGVCVCLFTCRVSSKASGSCMYVCMYVYVCVCVYVCIPAGSSKASGLCVCVCLCVCVYPQGVINSNFSNGLQT